MRFPLEIDLSFSRFVNLATLMTVASSLALLPQRGLASGTCQDTFKGTPVVKTTLRGIASIRLDAFVQAIRSEDRSALVNWLANEKKTFPSLKGLQVTTSTTLPQLAKNIFSLQISLRDQIQLKERAKNETNLSVERKTFVTLQLMLEETIMAAKAANPKLSSQFVFENTPLTSLELANATKMRGQNVLAGDVLVQIGATALSSHFIAGSQTSPGLASHSLLVSKTSPRAEILEALIEDGVNRRDASVSPLARFWVLSSPDSNKRADAAISVDRFISDERIPFVEDQKMGTNSPLLYDSSMNPDRVREGSYFCTALVQEVYRRAGFASRENPFTLDRSNWNSVRGLEREVYELIGINKTEVPAPGDALMNPNMIVRGLTLDAEGLRSSRRLKAGVDAIYSVLRKRPDLKARLFSAIRLIPEAELKKEQLLSQLRMGLERAEALNLIPKDGGSVQNIIAGLQESLPQSASLRQITFFVLLNKVMQNRILVSLEKFESTELKRHALPGELKEKAESLVERDLETLIRAISTVGQG